MSDEQDDVDDAQGSDDDDADDDLPQGPYEPVDEDPDEDPEDNPWGIAAAVVIDLGYQYDVVTGEYEYEYAKRLLYLDGSAYYGLPNMHLDDFDVAQSKASDADDWGQWEVVGDELRMRRQGEDWVDYDGWFPLTIPAPGTRLDGVYVSHGVFDGSYSDGSNTFFATGWNVVRFSADGRFEEHSGGSVTTDSGVVLDQSQTRGTYEILGPTIALTFEDGTELENTLLMSSAAERTLFINGVQFLIQD